jgi:hypothetical protein
MTPDAAPIPLMQCPIAGLQFHGGERCLGRIRPGEPLELQREPGNRHDPRAITVAWQGVTLGYVPREANYALSQMMDRGARVAARVIRLREGGDPWHRVMIEVAVGAPPAALVVAKPPAREEVILMPGRPMHKAPLTLAPWPMSSVPPELNRFEPVLREIWADAARRLSEPLRGVREPDAREVILWGSVVLRIGADGRGLSARFLEAPTLFHYPFLTHDLKRPIGERFWSGCVLRSLRQLCIREGLEGVPNYEAIRRWMVASLQVTFAEHIPFEALRQGALRFLAPDPLARSLTNRVFGNGATVDKFNWVGRRVASIALCAVEHPGMLPFLRLVPGHDAGARDPLATLHQRLTEEGLEPAAWKSLPRWGFSTFEALPPNWRTWQPIASLANLLQELELKQPPPREFVPLALTAALHAIEPADEFSFTCRPPWFMRALLRETERAVAQGQLPALKEQLPVCLDWLLDADPHPDANQEHAGWPWIHEQAKTHRHLRELELLAPWPVPFKAATWPPGYRIVAIDTAAALVAEGKAMKNCLADYEYACRAGDVLVLSIRDQATDERLACFAASRDGPGQAWTLIDVAGKMNSVVNEKIARVAEGVVAKMNALLRR